MNKLQKKNRLQSCNSENGKRKTFTVKSIARKAEKIKCVVATKDTALCLISRIFHFVHIALL